MASSTPAHQQLIHSRDLSFLESEHYAEWLRMVKRSVGPKISIIKFLVQLLLFTGESVSLASTLILGTVIPTKDSHETYIAIGLYLISWMITVAVIRGNKTHTVTNDGNEDGSTDESQTDTWSTLLIYFSILKPVRYAKMYSNELKMRLIIKENSEDKLINEPSLKAVVDFIAEELKNKQVEFHEAFLQSIPMMLLQITFLLTNNETFTLCDVGDVSRLVHIITVMVQAAKSVAAYESTISNYQAAQHFLSFYRSGGNHPLRIYSAGMVSWTGMANFVCHFCTIFSRIYPATYFLSTSWILSVAYFASIYIINLILLKLFPHIFLEVQENAPFGVSTTASYYADRYIGIFCNFGTRFAKFSGEIKLSEHNKKYWYRIPLIIWQIPIFGAAVYGIKSVLKPFFKTVIAGESQVAATTLNSTLSACPKVAAWYGTNAFTKSIGNSLFSSYKYVNDSFDSYNAIFQMGHPVWLLFYAATVFTLVYSYADLRRRLRNPADVPEDESNYFDDSYPIIDAYRFWTVLIQNVCSGQCRSIHEKRDKSNRIKKLMLLTIWESNDFYRKTRRLKFFPKLSISDEYAFINGRKVARKLSETEAEVDAAIQICFDESGHPMVQLFGTLYQKFLFDNRNSLDDKKLFLAFFATIDRKLYKMRSDRIVRIFQLLDVEVRKFEGDISTVVVV